MAASEVVPGLRADAERNRQRLVAAAREVFIEQGLNASMRQIARRAGVSEPTLRRRFSSKAELVDEVFKDKIAAYADAAEEALADPDPWDGFTGFMAHLTEMQPTDRGFTEVLTMTFPASMRLERERRRGYEAFTAVVTRAQQAGRLREDFVAEDLILLLIARAGIVAGAGAIADQLAARLLAYLLQAFAAPGAGSLPAAPSMAETYRALLAIGKPRDATPNSSARTKPARGGIQDAG